MLFYIFGLAALLMLVAILLLIFVKPQKRNFTEKEFKKYWLDIERLVKGGDDLELKQSVIEADKLLDKVLKGIVSGDTLGKRLINSKKIFRNYQIYQELWQAHKLRNKLVHEVGYPVDKDECKLAIKAFRNGFKDLGY